MASYENDDDEELQGCFQGCCRRSNIDNEDNNDIGPRCMCLPYRDPFLITAQGLSILGFFCSFTWWVNLVLGLMSMVGFQFAWCRRPSKWILMEALIFALAAAAAALYSGIHNSLSPYQYCNAFIFDVRYQFDHLWMCKDLILVSIVDALLWMATAGCTIGFHFTGRYARWEDYHIHQHNNNRYHHNNNNNNNNNNGINNTTDHTKEKDGARPESARPGNILIPTNEAASSKHPGQGLDDKRAMDEDEETETTATTATTTTTINDGAFAPREMLEQMMDDDSDDDEEFDEEKVLNEGTKSCKIP